MDCAQLANTDVAIYTIGDPMLLWRKEYPAPHGSPWLHPVVPLDNGSIFVWPTGPGTDEIGASSTASTGHGQLTPASRDHPPVSAALHLCSAAHGHAVGTNRRGRTVFVCLVVFRSQFVFT